MAEEMTAWEKELLADHRWGRRAEIAAAEHERLKKLWEKAQPLEESCNEIAKQIVALEICNWHLEKDVPGLCRAIGAKQPVERRIGHLESISAERWRPVWAYYLMLRNWAKGEAIGGYEAALPAYDPDRTVQSRILAMLGDRDELKELYVERFCLCLEFWLAGYPLDDSARVVAHRAAVSAVEEKIRQRDPEGKILNAMKDEGNGRLQPCHHKAFRRYDIILSSIGAGKWRGAMPPRGDGPAERVATLGELLAPIQAWLDDPGEGQDGEAAAAVRASLGEPDAAKVFLASLLRSQQHAAEARAEQRRQPLRPQVFSCPQDLIAADGTASRRSGRWEGLRGSWSVDETGRIVGGSTGNGYVCFLEEHADDLRVTATMRAVEGIEVSVWMCGSRENTEHDGYTLAVSTEGAKLQRRGQDVARVDATRIGPNRDHELAFQRRGQVLRGFLDGAPEPFVEWTDPEPLRGEGHRTLGFYVWDGAIAASRIKVEEFAK